MREKHRDGQRVNETLAARYFERRTTMDGIERSLHRIIEPPQTRTKRPAPPAAAEGCLTDKQVRALATALTCWMGGAKLALLVTEIANRADPAKVSSATLRKVNLEVCELLDSIADFEPIVNASLKYAAKLANYKMREQRLVDAVYDRMFECDVKIALLGG